MTIEAVSYMLQMPPVPPQPEPGCVICTRLDEQRAQARRRGDYSRVSDCNVRMRGHTHRVAPISR